MAKKAKAPPAPKGKTAQAVGLFSAMLGLPPQIRLSAREQQRAPAPFVVKGKKGGRER
jgi:hypothetical protein